MLTNPLLRVAFLDRPRDFLSPKRGQRTNLKGPECEGHEGPGRCRGTSAFHGAELL